LLRHLDREYDLYDIAVMTRAAPARLLGLPDRGQLGPGAIADISVYSEQDDKAAMFRAADLVLKSGQIVVEQGRVVATPAGRTYAIAPAFDRGIERSISDYFDRYHLVGMDHYAMRAPGLAETLGADLVVLNGRQAA